MKKTFGALQLDKKENNSDNIGCNCLSNEESERMIVVVRYFFMLFMVFLGLFAYIMNYHGGAFATWVLTICTTIITKE